MPELTAFYVPDTKGVLGFIEGEEAKHCIKVLRKKVGDSIIVFDGKTAYHYAILTDITKNKCGFRIESTFKTRENIPLHIAVAPTKNMARFEWFLEKSVELAVSEISPLICDNSVRKSLKIDRCQKILLSAAKQSGNYKIPKLNPPISYVDFFNKCQESNVFIAHCSTNQPYFKCKQNAKATVLIGPEGDFSKKEIDLAKNKGVQEISLGSSRLRTETAAVFVCAKVYDINQ